MAKPIGNKYCFQHILYRYTAPILDVPKFGQHLTYCVSLKTKGEGYLREKQQRKKTTYLILGRTVVLAIISFVVTLILKAIFKF